MSEKTYLSGGCQCGAIRYRASDFGRSSLCHCRMCQKALGGPFAALVTAKDLEYTRGKPKHFQSSNKVKRGFCSDCGTPLTFEFEGWAPDITVTTMDEPDRMPPVIQLATDMRLPWCERVIDMPGISAEETAKAAAHYAAIKSYQHPDHDTASWPQQDPSE
ncbi:GFA family protein [Roseibium suaedae]|uniref:Uncharacterized conserved protein n=1 Tax=Roseibium suaedae TaxID=735517 RepID=A0A1M7LMU1_9HYPH|nr:GFA family protein [Roseibium suaedae]SHM79452.1 Uncharacterized conserved protein [Roseibium suaedae]